EGITGRGGDPAGGTSPATEGPCKPRFRDYRKNSVRRAAFFPAAATARSRFLPAVDTSTRPERRTSNPHQDGHLRTGRSSVGVHLCAATRNPARTTGDGGISRPRPEDLGRPLRSFWRSIRTSFGPL